MAQNLEPVQTQGRSLPEIKRCVERAWGGEQGTVSTGEMAVHTPLQVFSRWHRFATQAWDLAMAAPRPQPGSATPSRASLGCDWMLQACPRGPGGSSWGSD